MESLARRLASTRTARAVLAPVARALPIDRRVRLRDVSAPGAPRGAGAPILQFYSGDPNIGNLTSVLGIQELLGAATDAWNVHRRPRERDWDRIHRRYRAAIVGGAGLLHPVFEPFWRELAERCRLPLVIWGVGGCWPDAASARAGASCPSAVEVGRRCELVNVRDDLSAERHGWDHAEVSACPTVAYVRRRFRRGRGRATLFCSHEALAGPDDTALIDALLSGRGRYLRTDNVQTRWQGLDDIIRRRFAASGRVVTTRLHGAIIAASLGIPWLALARDEKLRAFERHHGGGRCVETLAQLDAALDEPSVPARPLPTRPLRAFATRARDFLTSRGVFLPMPGV